MNNFARYRPDSLASRYISRGSRTRRSNIRRARRRADRSRARTYPQDVVLHAYFVTRDLRYAAHVVPDHSSSKSFYVPCWETPRGTPVSILYLRFSPSALSYFAGYVRPRQSHLQLHSGIPESQPPCSRTAGQLKNNRSSRGPAVSPCAASSFISFPLSFTFFFAFLSPVPLYPNGIPGGNVRDTRGEIQVGRDGERELTTHRKNLQGRNVEMRRQVKTVNRCRAGRRLIKSVPTADVSSRFTNGSPSLTSTISRSVLVGSRSIETHRCRNVRNEKSEKILDKKKTTAAKRFNRS